MRRDHAIDRAAELAWIQLRVLGCGVVEDLQFAHSHIGSVALARVTDGQAIVTAGWQLELNTCDKIAVLCLRMDGAASLRAAYDRAFPDLIVVDRTSPTVEVPAVENG